MKLSLLFFLLRVFGQSSIKWPAYCTMALCVGYGISFTFAVIFQCHPIPMAWMQLDDAYVGQCIKVGTLSWMTATLNIVLDVIIVALPQRELFNLNVSFKKKLMIMGMFCCGAAYVPSSSLPVEPG